MKKALKSVALLALALGAASCLPTVDPAKQQPASPTPATAPPAAPETAIPIQPPAPPAATPSTASPQATKVPQPLPPAKLSTTPGEDGAAPSTTMKMQVQEDPSTTGPGTATVRVEPDGDGKFKVSGGKALSATITRQEGGSWLLEGSITFPAKGYVPSEPFATSLDTMQGVNLQKSNAMTTVTIPFKYPPKIDRNAMTEESFPLKYKFEAPATTQFLVMLLPGS
jgi:hypothetical protein